LWKRDEDPIISIKSLLPEWDGDVDIFDLAVPNEVTAIAWGIKRIARHVSGMVVEVALDATCQSPTILTVVC
jgi:hypothetical protein